MLKSTNSASASMSNKKVYWFVCIIFAILIAFGFLKTSIDFITWWDTPRFADWEYEDRATFLVIWLILSILATPLARFILEKGKS